MAEKNITRFIRANSVDPWFNMAVEEYLLNHVSKGEVICYLWQIKDTVMIGKHQCAWKECNCQQLENDGGKLARRISGGGAVFQDLGNINFTFITDKDLYSLEKQIQTIVHAVNKFGINAEFSGRNDLTVSGRKFSGNAFCFRGKGVLHHGTLLINSDISKLTTYLQVSKEKIASKGVDSVRSRVNNLSSLNSTVTVEAIFKSLVDSFSYYYGGNIDKTPINPDLKEINDLYEKHASWEWRYGETPEFDISYQKRFVWGEIEFDFEVTDGHVTTLEIYSDAMDSSLIDSLKTFLIDIPFSKDIILGRIKQAATTLDKNAITEDIIFWLNSKLN